jgi:hypothetical protein
MYSNPYPPFNPPPHQHQLNGMSRKDRFLMSLALILQQQQQLQQAALANQELQARIQVVCNQTI